MAISYWAGGLIRGLSTDTKPDHAGLNGYNFIETDTGSIYRHNGTSWARIHYGRKDPTSGFIAPMNYRFTIYMNSSFETMCYDNYTGVIASESATDPAIPFQYACDQQDAGGSPFGIFVAAGVGSTKAANLHFLQSVTPQSYQTIVGEGKNSIRCYADGDFPVFDCSDTNYVTIKNLGFYQDEVTYSEGMIKVATTGSVRQGHIIDNCNFQAFGSGLGIGNCIWLENSTVTGLGDVGLLYITIRDCNSYGFEYFCRMHGIEDGDWINGVTIDNCFIDDYVDGVVKTTHDGTDAHFDGNVVSNTQSQTGGQTDTNAICFDFDDTAGTHLYNRHTNNMMWDLGASMQYMTVNASNLGLDLVNCLDDSKIGGSGYTAANIAGKINRKSQFSQRSGKAVFSGDGSTTFFDINHGLSGTPTKAFITNGSINTNYTVALGSSVLTVTYTSAPASGTDNVVIYWKAEL